MEYYLVIQNRTLLFARAWMYLEGEIRERQILYGINYMWNLKYYNKLVNITK